MISEKYCGDFSVDFGGGWFFVPPHFLALLTLY